MISTILLAACGGGFLMLKKIIESCGFSCYPIMHKDRECLSIQCNGIKPCAVIVKIIDAVYNNPSFGAGVVAYENMVASLEIISEAEILIFNPENIIILFPSVPW